MTSPPPPDVTRYKPVRRLIHRHSVVVRVTHWTAVVCIAILLMSGLQIFNAHPALYWGERSDFDHPLLRMSARSTGGDFVGVTTLFGHSFRTTGWLGASTAPSGRITARGFPAWITLPSYQDLATGRRWHFFFAWLLVLIGSVYLIYSLIGGHAWRDLTPSREQLHGIGTSLRDHARLRFPEGKEAEHYNVLQKLSYVFVGFVLVPVLVLAGLAMSPGVDSVAPLLPDMFGGRQSARTIHFVAAFLLVGFALVHILMVLLSGVFNNLRSMITGNYAVTYKDASDADRSL
ncbi:MAG TPA: cytochrome b/b6 domain-containing protein [Xanthobacteraceae bacterium]|nr:cytochrome b/b6 domain-containing protein [Xanthobacteraceae bacterium]